MSLVFNQTDRNFTRAYFEMPTVIALDVSLSMRRPVLTNGTNDNLQNEPLTRHHLAVHGINALLHYLQVNSKLEFVSLVRTS